jgi:flap endonuclease-1
MHFDKLKNKSLAVDISIYMYKFLSEDALIKNTYTMLSLFKFYQIKPIFVFDGKPPAEKMALLKIRREEKYKKIQETEKEKENDNDNEQCNLNKKIFLTKKDIDSVKILIHAFGFTYCEAPNEADEVCAILCLKEKVWGCISEDTDMFVYGCQNVIRYLNLSNKTCVYYDFKNILIDLNISQDDFIQICVLSGTDYNVDNPYTTLNIFDIFKQFKQHKNLDNIISNTYNFHHILKMFKPNIHQEIVLKPSNIDLKYMYKNQACMDVLKTDGFIFSNQNNN